MGSSINGLSAEITPKPYQRDKPLGKPMVTLGSSPVVMAPLKAVSRSPWLPLAYREQIVLPEGAQVIEDRDQAHLLLSVNDGRTLSHWVYTLVAPFPTIDRK